MNPIIIVSLDGNPLKGFDKRAVAGEIIEHDGEHADQLHITVSNYDGKLKKPATGKTIQVSLGSKEHGTIKAGQFVVDECIKTGPRAEFQITGHAADLGKGDLKKQKTRSWKAPKTYGDVFQDIAKDSGLTPRIDGQVAVKKIAKIVAQTGESDMHLGTRLARALGCIFKVGDGNLVVVPKGKGTTASGGAAASITITPNDLESNFAIATRDRPRRGKVKATYYDRDKAMRKEIESEGDNDGDAPDYAFPQIFGGEDDAQEAADARKGEFSRAQKSFQGTYRTGLFGVPAGGTITSKDFGDDDDQDWHCKRRIFHFDQKGVVARFQAETKKSGPSS